MFKKLAFMALMVAPIAMEASDYACCCRTVGTPPLPPSRDNSPAPREKSPRAKSPEAKSADSKN